MGAAACAVPAVPRARHLARGGLREDVQLARVDATWRGEASARMFSQCTWPPPGAGRPPRACMRQ
eukprot:4775828-Pyramimonas_sp.AAC.1